MQSNTPVDEIRLLGNTAFEDQTIIQSRSEKKKTDEEIFHKNKEIL